MYAKIAGKRGSRLINDNPWIINDNPRIINDNPRIIQG
jgi:hypothetical protein